MLFNILWLESEAREKLAQKHFQKAWGKSNQKVKSALKGQKSMQNKKENPADMHGGNEAEHPCIIAASCILDPI